MEFDVDVGDAEDPLGMVFEMVKSADRADGEVQSDCVRVHNSLTHECIGVFDRIVDIPQAPGKSRPFGVRAHRNGKSWIVRDFDSDRIMRQSLLDMLKAARGRKDAPTLEMVRFV